MYILKKFYDNTIGDILNSIPLSDKENRRQTYNFLSPYSLIQLDNFNCEVCGRMRNTCLCIEFYLHGIRYVKERKGETQNLREERVENGWLKERFRVLPFIGLPHMDNSLPMESHGAMMRWFTKREGAGESTGKRKRKRIREGTDSGNLEEAERSLTFKNTLTHCVPLHF